jgi:hypothetical protein
MEESELPSLKAILASDASLTSYPHDPFVSVFYSNHTDDAFFHQVFGSR